MKNIVLKRLLILDSLVTKRASEKPIALITKTATTVNLAVNINDCLNPVSLKASM
jgi:hypothetical protein